MSANKDLSYAFALSRQCLRLLGAWPDPRVPVSDLRCSSIRFIIVTCIVSFYVIVPQLTNMIRAWGNVALIVEYVASANYSLIAVCKLMATWYHGETLRTLMKSIMTDWISTKSNEKRCTMLKIVRKSRSLSFQCFFTTFVTAVFYIYFHLNTFLQHVHQLQRPIVYGPFPYPYVQKSPGYEITYFTQMCSGIYAAFINCTVDSFVSTLVLHVCSQLINLRTTLNDLVKEVADKSMSSLMFQKNLGAIIMRHEHLISNARTIDNCYSAVLFVHTITLTFQLCFQAFRVYIIITEHLEVPPEKLFFLSLYVVMVVTHLYIYCYSSERLLQESTGIAYGVYQCKWYELSSKDARDLMFIVHRSANPLKLTAGKFGTFSIEMFGNSIKTSMGYLSTLLTMKGIE